MTRTWLATAWLGLCASSARAEPEPGSAPSVVEVEPTACRKLPWADSAWSELLSVELAADGISVHFGVLANPAENGPHVAIEVNRCDDAATSATLVYVLGEHRHERTIDLADVAPIARPRVLAMAIADLVRSGPADRIPVAPPPTAFHGAPQRTHRPAAVMAMAEASRFSRTDANLFGPRIGVETPIVRRVVADVDAGVLFGRAHDPLGTIDGTVATVGLGVLATGGTSAVRFGLGLRGQVGVGWFHGIEAAPQVSESRAWSPLAFLAVSGLVSFPVVGGLRAVLGVEAGTSLDGFIARADQRAVFDTTGPMVLTRLGLTWATRLW